MPEIKNTFTQGKMNKDLDERIVPNGQYRDAMNIQVSTSEGSDVGTVQNILGNSIMNNRGEVVIPLGYECVGSIADEKNDTLYSFVTDDTDSAIIEYTKDGDASPVLVDLGNNVLQFSTGDIITGINIIDNLLFWTDGVSEPKKINIDTLKLNNHTNLNTHSNMYVNNSPVGFITEEHITVIKKKPLRPLSVKINPATSTDRDPLFEKIFPRFSYRYRYADGEYSAFAPFTDVVFNSKYPIDQNGVFLDENTAYDTKEPYNSGMVNMIESIELYDFVSPSMPEDVVQIDLLYKQENSNVIYVLDIFKDTNTEWNEDGITGPASDYKGKFIVKSENIYAALPGNQLLRSWDNVPRTALAQEVTGNRLVYGNYTQSYNVPFSPKVVSDYKLRFPTKESPYLGGGLPSVKSQRNYQLGVVYGDKYGRETPVFTSSESSIVIPWDDLTSEDPSGNDYPLASFSLRLEAYLDSPHPTDGNGNIFDYYKFFVKETSGEYYNLVMDAMYNPIKSDDLDTEDHMWISFASSDRNKISEDDYIILKKVTSIPRQVLDENKFKILDVKNEAPDAIKYKFEKLGEIENDATVNLANTTATPNLPAANGILNHEIFYNPDKRPLIGPANDDPIMLHIHKANWLAQNCADLIDGDDLYFSFIKSTTVSTQASEKKYKIANVRLNDAGHTYIVKLAEKITANDAILAESTVADEIDPDITVVIERKINKDLEAFSGRFFVKILMNSLTKSTLEGLSALAMIVAGAEEYVFYHADTEVVVGGGGNYDITNHLVNNNSSGTTIPTSDPTDVHTSTSATKSLTDTATEWDALLTEMTVTNSKNSRWFIDKMYMVAEQTRENGFAKYATYGWGDANTVGDSYGSGNSQVFTGQTVRTLPTNCYFQNCADPLYQHWPTINEIKPNDPGVDGANLINGLEGVVETDTNHIINGIRRWRHVNWDPYQSNSTVSDSNVNYSSSIGKFFIHLSYLAPGEDLHNGEFECLDSELRLDSTSLDYNGDDLLHNNLQGIWGGGVFSSDDTNSDKEVFAEVLPIGSPTSDLINDHGGSNEDYGGPGVSKLKHENQWKLPVGGDDEEFASNLSPGKKFIFIDDTNLPPTIYEIKNVSSTPKKIYNHTPWRKMWKSKLNGTAEIEGMNTSVEEVATIWGNDTDSSGVTQTPSKVEDLRNKLEEFGKANNRRLTYLIEVDIDSSGENYNPVNGTFIDSDSPGGIRFITEDPQLTSGEVSQTPAIWETEPKDNVDLDIYYEAGQAYPITLTPENAELFAPIGCRVQIFGQPREYVANPDPSVAYDNFYIDGNAENYLQNWYGTVISLDSSFSGFQANATNDQGIVVPLTYNGLKIRFTREDGSYTTGIINDPGLHPASLAGGYHAFNIVTNPNGSHGLGWYNCFSFGNGIESDRIRDDFNAMTLTNGVRASSTLDRPYTEEHRKSGMIYSGIYNSTSGINNLNQFIAAEKITKDLNPTYGSIQKLFSRRISLIAFCEDRVVGITANKNALYNADGKPQLVATNAVLGDANPFVGDYGISQNPESFAKESYRAYFTDKQRGAVLRLSMDGLTPISDAGMSDWFKDQFKKPDYNFIGSFDNYKNDYNLTIDGGTGIPALEERGDSYTLTYSEDVKGWVSFKSFIQESGVSMAGDYYTFKAGKCYKHNSNESRNTFYGRAAVPSTIKFLLNESPSVIKNFNTLNYDGDGLSTWNYTDQKYDFEGWFGAITTDQQNGTIIDFIEKEGKWFNYITGATGAVLDTSAFNFQGLGVGFIQYSI